MTNTSNAVRAFLLACVAALAIFPWFGSEFYAELVTKVMILAIFAMSLDLLVGFTGLVSFGHAAFFGIAAYTVALLTPEYDSASLWFTLPLAMLAATAAALVIGVFVLRTKGIYFIMVTLAFAQMVYFVFHDTPVGGGSDGIFISFKPTTGIPGLDLGDVVHFYYFSLAALVLVYLFLQRVLRSPFGHALVGIKVNEQRMRSVGFPVFYYKLASFALAGGLAGVAGYLSAVQFGFVNPEILSWHQSGNVLLMVILGGLGNLYGAVVGAFTFILLQEFFSTMTKHWQLLLGLTIVVLVLFLPGGLSSLANRFKAGLFGGGKP